MKSPVIVHNRETCGPNMIPDSGNCQLDGEYIDVVVGVVTAKPADEVPQNKVVQLKRSCHVLCVRCRDDGGGRGDLTCAEEIFPIHGRSGGSPDLEIGVG